VKADFSHKIIRNDEAHLPLDGFVNRQNCRILGSENSYVAVQIQMHLQRVAGWCGF